MHMHTLKDCLPDKESIFPFTFFYMTSFLDPVSQVAHEIKEEVSVGNTDHLRVPRAVMNSTPIITIVSDL